MTVHDLTSRMMNYNEIVVRIYKYNDAYGVELIDSEDRVFSDISKYADIPVKMWYMSANHLNIII